MLPEEVIKDCSIFFVDSLHLIDVLGNSLHTYQGLHQMLLLIRVGCCQRFELKKMDLLVNLSELAAAGDLS